VLRFAPESIVLESRTAVGSVFSIAFDGALSQADERTCTLGAPGTRLTLRRRAREPNFTSQVRARLVHHCRYLRSRDKGPLPITFNGELVTAAGFSIEAPLSMAFADRDAEGIVALGESPRVELYARGLLVMEASVLEELEGGGGRARTRGAGLAPIVIMNVDHLDVVLSRQKPRSSKTLKRAVAAAKKRLDRLARAALDGAVPRTPKERVVDALAGMVRAFGGVRPTIALLLWCVFMFSAAWTLVDRETKSGPPVRSEVVVPLPAEPDPPLRPIHAAAPQPMRNINYDSAVVDDPEVAPAPWRFNYDSHAVREFKVLTLDHYDENSGWLRRPMIAERGKYRFARCTKRPCVHLELDVGASEQPYVIPVPTGHRVVERGLTFDGKRLGKLDTNELGEALLPPSSGGKLSFFVAPTAEPPPHPTHATFVPWPPAWSAKIKELRAQPEALRAMRATTFVRDALRYDIGSAAARRFAQLKGPWIDRVLTNGGGDCDVKNGVNALMLRELDLPARVAIGLAGDGTGHASATFHAWTEYYLDGHWHALDATGLRPTPARVAGSAMTVVATPAPLTTVDLNEPPPPPAFEPPRVPDLILVLGIMLAIFVILLALLLLRAQQHLRLSGDATEKRDAVARMLRDMLVEPGAWQGAEAIRHRKVLPVLRGRPMSLAEAQQRSRDGNLFVTRTRSALARAATAPVLDASDPAFGKWVLPLLHTIDIDALAPFVSLAESATLVDTIAGVELRVAAFDGPPLRDLDLSRMRGGKPTVLLNAAHPETAQRLKLLREDPRRGPFILVDWLVDHSALFSAHGERLRAAAAEKAVA
jgi:hypothetical protein